MTRSRWGLGAAVVGAGVLLALLARAASGPPVETPPPATVTARADIFLTPDTELIRGLVPRNATLDAFLKSQGLAVETVARVIAAVRETFDPRRFRATQPFVLERTTDGALRRFEYEIDADNLLRVTPFAAVIAEIPKARTEVTAIGAITAETPSLFEAMEAAGERPDLSIALAEIFSGEIDFNTELQPGDTFGLAFEKFTREDCETCPEPGRGTTYGEIAAAEFHNDGRVVRAIRFTPPGGKPAYYDEHGRSLKRFFLRSPLKFEPRITSGFSRRRFHPVLHTYRAHLGVDYGAPTGAPVVAVAAGTVIAASYDHANGRMVRLKHPSGYETYYLHLSAFGAGIRAGARVSQGQVIGKVGSTGLASGPHLDYRLKKNGAFVNPLAEHRRMPPGEPVPAAALEAFKQTRDAALGRLEGRLAGGG